MIETYIKNENKKKKEKKYEVILKSKKRKSSLNPNIRLKIFRALKLYKTEHHNCTAS